jgi:hypothetical protein
MNDVSLYTAGGDFVVQVPIPPFQHKPEVIMWGHRVFWLCPDDKYYEAFCYFVPKHAV